MPVKLKHHQFLLMRLQYFSKNTSGIKNHEKYLKTTLSYDTASKYHYYKIKQLLGLNDSYTISIKTNFKKGFIYVFRVDAANNSIFIKAINIDTNKRNGNIILNKDNKNILKYYGIEHVCLWYSKKGIGNYKDMAEGIEMTNGDFILRNKIEIGESFQWPTARWHFNKTNASIYATPILFKASDNVTIPLIIELNIKNKIHETLLLNCIIFNSMRR